MVSRTDHKLGHKTSLNKPKRLEIISIFSSHVSMILDINYRKESGKNTNTWRLDKMVLKKSQWVKIFLVVQWLRLHAPNAGGPVQFLVEELDPAPATKSVCMSPTK